MLKINNLFTLLRKDGFKKVFSNFSWLSFSQLIERLAAIIVIPYLIKVIGIDNWGKIVFAQSFILYFGTIVGYGFHLTGVKDISQNRDSFINIGKIFYTILVSKIFLLIISFIIYFSVVIFFVKFRSEFLLFFFNFLYLIGYCIYPDWFFQGIEEMKFSTIFSFFSRFMYVFLVFAFIKKPSDYIFVPLLNSISIIFIGIFGLFLAVSKIKKVYLPKIKDIVFQLKNGFHIFLSQVYLSIYSNSRVFLLGIFSTSDIVGNYALAEKIINISGIPMGMFTNAVFPRLSLKFKENINSFKKIFKIIEVGSFLWATFLCGSILIFGKLILSLFAKDFFSEVAMYSLNFLTLALFFNQISVFLIQYFVIINKITIFSKIYLIATIIGLILLFITTPMANYKGIIIASIAFEITIFSLSVYFLKKFKT